MFKLFSMVTRLLLPLLVISAISDATIIKRPLTLKQYADQRYLEWTGTANFASAETLAVFADTAAANLYALDPASFLFTNKSATAGFNPWMVYPGNHIPEKMCSRSVVSAQADSSTVGAAFYYANTKTGALITGAGTSTNLTVAGTTAAAYIVNDQADPGKFFVLKFVISSATDSAFVTRVTIFPCDD